MYGTLQILIPGAKTFTLDYGGREEVVSVDRLKPAHIDLSSPVSVNVPPKHGRPPTISRTPSSRQEPHRNPVRQARKVCFNYD